MPNLTGRVADVTRTDAVIDYLPTKLPWAGLDARFANNFAVRETGFLEVSTPGRYKISLRSKDGAKLWLDGKLLVNNGGIHPVRQRTKAVTLTAGLHALRVDSFANTGVAALDPLMVRPWDRDSRSSRPIISFTRPEPAGSGDNTLAVRFRPDHPSLTRRSST